MPTDAELAAIKDRFSAHATQHSADRQLPKPQMDWKFFTPLFWAPAFPFIRHSTKGMKPGTRNMYLGIAIAIANLHGFWLINNPDLSDEALEVKS